MHQAFKLYAEKELDGVRDFIDKKLSAWSNDWSNSSFGYKVEVDVKKTIIDEEYCYSTVQDVDPGGIKFFVNEAFYQNFPVLLFPIKHAQHPHTENTIRIISDALNDLLNSLYGKENSDVSNSLFIKQSTDELLNSVSVSCLYVKISSDLGAMCAVLPVEYVKGLNVFIESGVDNGSELAKIKDCMITGDLLLDVNIGETEVDFGSVVDMRIGDVIRLDSKVSDTMNVFNDAGDFVCKAYLGKKDKHKALKVII